jgi:hypothetical protein
MKMQTYNSNSMIIEEGGSYEEGISDPALSRFGLSQVQLSLNRLAEMQIVRTRVRDDTPGVI